MPSIWEVVTLEDMEEIIEASAINLEGEVEDEEGLAAISNVPFKKIILVVTNYIYYFQKVYHNTDS